MASGAHGVATRVDLLAAGVTVKEIAHRVRAGALIPEYPGVYRVGHAAPSTPATYMAAVKAGGDGALLCGRAAAYLLGIFKSPNPPPPEVMTTKDKRVGKRRRVDPRDATEFNNIPVTTVPRTLVDLAAVLSEDDLARACHEAGVKYRTTPRQVEAVLKRYPNAKGAATLRKVMTGDVKVTLSKLESRFLDRLRENRLPLPETNKTASARRVDCRWPEQHVTVELDGFRFHNSRYSWRQGLKREREARARGDEFRRYDYEDVFTQPAEMLQELRGLLT